MGVISITLATEDILSEAVGERLIGEQGGRLEVALRLRRNGFGYLKSRLPSFCEMAMRQPVLLITDLDHRVCPSVLLSDWLGERPRPPGLLLRIAVREVESWVLADHATMRAVLHRPGLRLPERPDELNDPKQVLIDLAKKGPRGVRDAIVPAPGVIASQGLGYNELLVDVVARQWNPEHASQRSESLRRARARLARLASLSV